MPTIPGDRKAKVFDHEIEWITPQGYRRSAKAVGYGSPVKASMMAKAMAADMGWPGKSANRRD